VAKKPKKAKTPKAPRSKAGSVDIVTGTWTWDGSEVVTGEVTSNNTPYKTYFGLIEESGGDQPGFSGYADSNRNGIYDAGLDLYVGNATLSPIATSAVFSGTWDADKKTGIANGYSGSNLVATADGVGFWFGNNQKAPEAPKQPKSSSGGSSSRDSITGTWSTIEFNRPNVIIDTSRRGGINSTYFGIATSGRGRVINFNGYKDSNSNRIYEPGVDAFVGSGSVTSLDGIIYNSGTFTANGNSWDAFVGGKLVATSTVIGSWFD